MRVLIVVHSSGPRLYQECFPLKTPSFSLRNKRRVKVLTTGPSVLRTKAVLPPSSPCASRTKGQEVLSLHLLRTLTVPWGLGRIWSRDPSSGTHQDLFPRRWTSPLALFPCLWGHLGSSDLPVSFTRCPFTSTSAPTLSCW